ncbi:MAG: hypothetical protein ABSG74_02225 [Candidatus Bathyarchaeia archaeon]
MSTREIERYDRQMMIRGWGDEHRVANIGGENIIYTGGHHYNPKWES